MQFEGRFAFPSLLAAIVLALSSSARADAAATAPAAAAPAPATAQARESQRKDAERALASNDPMAVRRGLETLGHLGSVQAATAIEARLRRGLPPALITTAIASLVELRKPSAEPVLVELTLHKRAEVREQAIAALGALRLQGAHPTLLRALDDPSPEVRTTAAQSLAQVGGARSVPALLRADERGVNGAMAAIGAVASPSDTKLVLQRAAQRDVIAVKPALQAMLDRPGFPLKAKLDLVSELAKLEGRGARAFLLERFGALQPGAQPEMRQALAAALKQVDGNPKVVTKDATPTPQPATVPTPVPSAAKAPTLLTSATPSSPTQSAARTEVSR
jgi:hypothetical protein